MRLSKSVKAEVDDEFLQEITEDFSDDFVEQYNRRVKLLKNSISAAMSRAIKDHPVFKGITGQYAGETDGMDLQAEFGLTDSMANRAGSEILAKLKESVDINLTANKRQGIITIYSELNNDYREKFTNFPFEYISTSFAGAKIGTRVEWMAFLLEAANSAISQFIDGVKDYGIIYADNENSRSGRATMTKDEDLADKFPYSINKRLISFSGDNFIEDAFGSDEFQEIVYNTIQNFIDSLI